MDGSRFVALLNLLLALPRALHCCQCEFSPRVGESLESSSCSCMSARGASPILSRSLAYPQRARCGRRVTMGIASVMIIDSVVVVVGGGWWGGMRQQMSQVCMALSSDGHRGRQGCYRSSLRWIPRLVVLSGVYVIRSSCRGSRVSTRSCLPHPWPRYVVRWGYLI